VAKNNYKKTWDNTKNVTQFLKKIGEPLETVIIFKKKQSNRKNEFGVEEVIYGYNDVSIKSNSRKYLYVDLNEGE